MFKLNEITKQQESLIKGQLFLYSRAKTRGTALCYTTLVAIILFSDNINGIILIENYIDT